jgi:DNA-binding FrmR family transcriptional regulator
MEKLQLAQDGSEYRQDVLKRLRRIEGQVKGVQKMIEEDKTCVEILTQVAAIRAAINKVGGLILERHSKACLKEVLKDADTSVGGNKAVEDLIDTVQKFLKFVD